MAEGLTLGDVAYMHFHNGLVAFLHGVSQRHARVRVPACVEDYPLNIIKRSVTIERHSRAHSIIRSLYPINQITLVIGLLVHKVDLRPSFLDVQQNLCHRRCAVYLRLPRSQTVQIRSV